MMAKKYKLPLDELKLTSIGKINGIAKNRGTFQLGPDRCAV